MWSWALYLFIFAVAQSNAAKVLIYSATTHFRHDSIPTAIEALKTNSSIIDVSFENTEDPSQFTDDVLSQYDAVLFLSTTGEVLDDSGKTALQSYFNLGGNFIGIHSSSDSLVNTTFFGRQIGAYFDYHPVLQNATVNVVDSSHPAVAMLPSEWQVQDEIYNFKSNPRSIGAVVILAANESSYTDDGERQYDQGSPHPLAWYQEHGAGVEEGAIAGRSFYTSLGHLNETWHDDLFLGHVLAGIQWTIQSNTTRAFNSSAQVGSAGGSPESAPSDSDSDSDSGTSSGGDANDDDDSSSDSSLSFPTPRSIIQPLGVVFGLFLIS